MDYSVDCDALVFNLMCIYITFFYIGRFMVAVLSISLPRDKLFDLQKMRYKGYLLAFLLTCFVGLFPTNALPVAGKIVFFCSCFLLILLFRNKYIRAAIITLLSCHLLAIF